MICVMHTLPVFVSPPFFSNFQAQINQKYTHQAKFAGPVCVLALAVRASAVHIPLDIALYAAEFCPFLAHSNRLFFFLMHSSLFRLPYPRLLFSHFALVQLPRHPLPIPQQFRA